jgi:hypothetical protein
MNSRIRHPGWHACANRSVTTQRGRRRNRRYQRVTGRVARPISSQYRWPESEVNLWPIATCQIRKTASAERMRRVHRSDLSSFGPSVRQAGFTAPILRAHPASERTTPRHDRGFRMLIAKKVRSAAEGRKPHVDRGRYWRGCATLRANCPHGSRCSGAGPARA